LEKNLTIDVGDQEITAVSAGVLWGKLLQVVQGFSYTDKIEGERSTVWHNEDKLDVLDDIIEESAGSPVLVFYHFKAEEERLLLRYPQGTVLGRGNAKKIVHQWNHNEIPVMFANPLSAGHGLNLQLGGANTIVWLCLNGSPEIYIQAVGRLWRQGQKNKTVMIHHLNMVSEKGSTIDEDIITMLENRTTVQEVMLRRLSALQQQRLYGAG
jgi:SNF2 family DNA or RNA helicase